MRPAPELRLRTRPRLHIAAALLALLFAPLLRAEKLARPSGPITITAKTAEWQEGVMIYTGAVVMSSKTLELRGLRLELRQPGGSKAPYEITLTGAPATMLHNGELPGDKPINARAAKLVYRSDTQEVELAGNAQLRRGKDELNGATMRYNVAARRVQASGGEGGQVRIVIDVPEAQEAMKKEMPPAKPTAVPSTPPKSDDPAPPP